MITLKRARVAFVFYIMMILVCYFGTYDLHETGKEIDTWKKWEKAGYRNPVEVTKNHQAREKIKENIKKRKG